MYIELNSSLSASYSATFISASPTVVDVDVYFNSISSINDADMVSKHDNLMKYLSKIVRHTSSL